MNLVRLIGVYDAAGTWRGELAYWVGARLGRRHCSLCEITHGMFRRRAEWDACRADLPVPFETFHRDDQSSAVREASNGLAPVVVAETDAGYMLLLNPGDVDACGGVIEALVEAIERAAARVDLGWPGSPT